MGLDPHKTLVRAVSGIVYVGIIVGGMFAGKVGLICIAALFGTFGILEFLKITKGESSIQRPEAIIDTLGILCLALAILKWTLWVWLLIMLTRMFVELWSRSSDKIRDISLSIFGQIYIGIPMACLSFGLGKSAMTVLLIFFLIWICDTGAFLVGCTLGRHKLYPEVSPKKSWEGAIGGTVFCVIASVLFCLFGSSFFQLPYNIGLWIGLSLVVAFFAIAGDLFESLIKRELTIKDSGKIIPGHGGILDRIDSLLFVMPAAAFYLNFFIWN